MFICVKVGKEQYEAIFPQDGFSYILDVGRPKLYMMNLRPAAGVGKVSIAVYKDQAAADIWCYLMGAVDEQTAPASIELFSLAAREAIDTLEAADAAFEQVELPTPEEEPADVA